MQIQLRSRGSSVTDAMRTWTERRVLFALGQFSGRVRTVRVTLTDENGPRGGVDQRCVMEARVDGAGPVMSEVMDPDLYAAVSRAADRLSRCVRSTLDRERSSRRDASAA